MSETIWHRRANTGTDTIIDGPSVSIYVDHDTDLAEEKALAERLVKLLSEDDERIAHAGHFDRAWQVWSDNGSQSPNEAWQAWWNAISAHRPSKHLDALEAACRATLPREQP